MKLSRETIQRMIARGSGSGGSVSVSGMTGNVSALLTPITNSLTTLEGYFTDGAANTALRLTGDATYKAWGQTYWRNGTPAGNLTGNLTNVENIYMANNKAVFITDSEGTPRNVLLLNTVNHLALGYGARLAGYTTDIQGNTITFGVGQTRVEAAQFNSAGQLWLRQGAQGLRIGDALLTWESATNSLRLQKNDGSAVNFYALGAVSALGLNAAGGTSGTGIDETQLALYLEDNGYAKLSDIPVVDLTGYATLQWVRQQNYLTEHQSLSDYATQQWVEDKGYLTSAALTGYLVKNVAFMKGKVDLDNGDNVVSTIRLNNGVLTFESNTLDITVPKKVSDLTNDAGFITASSLTPLTNRLTTLEGYFTDGAAKTALRLTGDTAYTAWGQTYWQDGKPRGSISGNMTGVGTIHMDGGIFMDDDGEETLVYQDGDALCIESAATHRYGIWVTGGTDVTAYFEDSIQIGSIKLKCENGAIHVIGGGLYADTFVSALGLNNTASGGALDEQAVLDLLAENNYVTTADLAPYALRSEIPSAPDLTNYATQSWVRQQGYATQSWVIAYVANNAGGGLDEAALAQYLTNNNYVTTADLAGYALRSEIPSPPDLSDYATQSWVWRQDYLTAQSLNGYATQQWVQQQNYLTSHQSLDGYVTQSALSNYCYTSGGSIVIGGNTVTPLTASDLDAYLPLAGGTMTGQITRSSGGYWKQGRDSAVVKQTYPSSESYNAVVDTLTSNGDWSIGVLGEALYAVYTTNYNYNNNNNVTSVQFPTGKSGTLALLTDTVAAAINATNATNATQLATAHTIWGQYFDGTQDVKGAVQNAIGIDFSGLSEGETHGGYIDFHYGGSETYTSRIIESASGTLGFDANISTRQSVVIGKARLSYDETNKAIRIDNADDNTAVSLYATGSLSALGFSGGKATVLDKLTITDFSSETTLIDELTVTTIKAADDNDKKTPTVLNVTADSILITKDARLQTAEGDLYIGREYDEDDDTKNGYVRLENMASAEDYALSATESAPCWHIHTDGEAFFKKHVQTKRLYLDDTRYIYLDTSGTLKFYNGTTAKTVSLA